MNMKKIAVLFAALLVVVGVTPAQAEQPATVVVIDTGFEASQLDNVILEVCVVSIRIGCNNNSGFEEGPGASGSNFRINPRFAKDWQHGTIMADIVNQVNPDANLILIRNSKVVRGNVIVGNLEDFEKALEWVQDNAVKHNIVAVSFSRGSNGYFKKASNNAVIETRIAAFERVIAIHKSRNTAAATIARLEATVADLRAQLGGVAPCPSNPSIESDIVALQNLGVATLIAAGNDGSRTNINEPACLEPAVAVSTRSIYDNNDGTANVTLNTNIGDATDFIALGTYRTSFGPVAESSSAATAALAAKWVKVYAGNYSATYELLRNSGVATAGFAATAVNVLD
jgi:hypothetical protein